MAIFNVLSHLEVLRFSFSIRTEIGRLEIFFVLVAKCETLEISSPFSHLNGMYSNEGTYYDTPFYYNHDKQVYMYLMNFYYC